MARPPRWCCIRGTSRAGSPAPAPGRARQLPFSFSALCAVRLLLKEVCKRCSESSPSSARLGVGNRWGLGDLSRAAFCSSRQSHIPGWERWQPQECLSSSNVCCCFWFRWFVWSVFDLFCFVTFRTSEQGGEKKKSLPDGRG